MELDTADTDLHDHGWLFLEPKQGTGNQHIGNPLHRFTAGQLAGSVAHSWERSLYLRSGEVKNSLLKRRPMLRPLKEIPETSK